MKYIHLYSDDEYCESDSFKGSPNTIELPDEQFEALKANTMRFEGGVLVAIPQGELDARAQAQAEQERKESIQHQISALKSKLAQTDYKALKYAEGLISEADYLPIKLERQDYRNQINELEAQA